MRQRGGRFFRPVAVSLLFQLHIPVQLSEKLFPAGPDPIVLRYEWEPGWTPGPRQQLQASLFGCPAPFLFVAITAADHAIIPGAGAALGAWVNVVNGQFCNPWMCTAVLAGVMIPLEDIPSRKHHLGLRVYVAAGQNHHLWHRNVEGHPMNQWTLGQPG